MTETHDVVILGSGPTAAGAVRSMQAAGLTDIVVLERESAAGGVPRHCGHWGFGIGNFAVGRGGLGMTGTEYARRLAELESAADLRTGHSVRALHPGGRLSIASPDRHYDIAARAVLLATGARETPRSARLIGGTRPQGIFTTGALQQWIYVEQRRPADRVVVLGSELVAFSTLLTCRHVGIDIAAIIEESANITARWPAEPAAKHLFGVPVLRDTQVVEILGDSRVSGIVIDQGGQRSEIACDGIVVSGHFVPETALLTGGALRLDPGSGGPEIDEFWRSSDPFLFAAGNLVHPIDSSGRCFHDGEAAGRAIAAQLAGNLPPLERGRPITAMGAIKYLYPQRLSGSAVPVFLRVKHEMRGRLAIRLDGRQVWSRQVHLFPERRVRLPAAPFAAPFVSAEVDLS